MTNKMNYFIKWAVWAVVWMILLILQREVAHGAPVPVKRPAPLLSPRHASQPKFARMTVPITEPPRLPMTATHAKVQSEYGTDEFTASATQPVNQSVLFEASPDMVSWFGLAYFPPYYREQPVFTTMTSYGQKLYIRAKATPVMPTGFTRLTTTGPAIWTNPKLRGVRAGRGLR